MAEKELRVLLVEDSPADADLVERTLRAAGLDPLVQRVQAQPALTQALESFRPDVVLCGDSPPAFTGMEALAVCRSQAPDTPVIFVSAAPGEERAVQALQRGAADYVLKANLARLAPAVREAIELARQRTRRRSAENRLRRMRFAIENTSDAVVWLDSDGRFRYANPALCRQLGYSQEELLGMHLWDVNPDFSAARWQASRKEVQARGRLVLESRHRAKDGRLIPVELAVNYSVCEGEELIFAFCRDLSDRKRSQEELRRSQEMLQLVIDNTPQRVFWKGRDFRYLGANQAFLDDAGLKSLGELIGKTDFELSWNAAAPIYRGYDEKVIATGQPLLGYEEPIPRPDGTTLTVRVNKVPLTDAEGRIIGVLGTYEDVGEQKRAAQALQESRQQSEFLAGLVRDSSLAMGVGYPDGRLGLVNRAAEELLGYTAEELRAIDWKGALTPPEWRQLEQEKLDELKRTGRPVRYEKEYIRKDGSRVPVELLVHLRADAQGQPLYYYAFITDITQRKRAEQERARLLKSEHEAHVLAEAASKAKDEFLAIVSHELRTPITAILGWSWLLRAGHLSPAERKNALAVIERNMSMEKQIIDDLLDVSTLARRQIALRKELLDLGEVVSDAVAGFKAAAHSKSQHLFCQPLRGLRVEGDPQRLRQVFWNLISNAVKFTPERGAVRVSMRREAGQALVSVEDTGPGISREFFPHLFDPFRQHEDSLLREHRGLGLGLAIVKQLAELHGGSVQAEPPAPGQGARFTVALPLAVSRHRARATPAAARAAPQLPGLLRGLHILVVEDDRDTRDMLLTLLVHSGAEVKGAASAREGFLAFSRSRPDLVLSDIAMPGEDGYALIKRIRALPAEKGGRVPAAALTAYTTAEERTKALRAGYQMFLPKPVDPGELVTVVRALAKGLKGPSEHLMSGLGI